MATSTRSFMALVPTAAADSGNSNIADSKSVFRTFLYIADLLVWNPQLPAPIRH